MDPRPLDISVLGNGNKFQDMTSDSNNNELEASLVPIPAISQPGEAVSSAMMLNAKKLSDSYGTILDAIPSMIFVMDRNIQIFYANSAALAFLGESEQTVLFQKGGEALHCLNATKSPLGCGHSDQCKQCAVRNSVAAAIQENKTFQTRTRMAISNQATQRDIHVIITAAPLQVEEQLLAVLTIQDISEVTEMRSLIPICANCKKIRNDKQYWEKVEVYLKTHLDVNFTHGICPDCAQKYYSQY